MSKIVGIIRYELLMGWRRRSLPVLVLFFLTALIFISVLVEQVDSPLDSRVVMVRVENGVTTIVRRVNDGSTVEETLDPETASQLPAWLIGVNLDQAGNTLRGITVLLPALMVMVIGIIPLLSDTIPLDRQYKVRELLDTAPLHRSAYLGGKVLSVWVGLLIGIALCFAAFQIVLYVRHGAYDLLPLLLDWLALVIPITLLVSFCVVLLTAWAGSRRAGLLTGLFLIPFGVYLYFTSVQSLGSVGRWVNPVYGLGVMDTYLNNPNYRALILNDMAGALVVYFVIFGAVWLLAWGDARLREAR